MSPMSRSEEEATKRNSSTRWWVLAIATLATFLSAVSAADITLALKPLLDEFHTGAPALVWVSLAYLVPFATVLLVAGKLADTAGHRVVLLGSLAIFTVASALGFVANDVTSVIILRALAGIGGAGLLVSLAFVALSFPPRQQGFALGIWRGALLIGTVGGPPLGGLLVATLGWRSVMWALAPFGFLALIIGWATLREPPRSRGLTRAFDWVGAIATTVGLSAFVLALNFTGGSSGGGGMGGGSPMMGSLATALWVVFALSALLFWWDARHYPWPIIQTQLLTIPRFILANVGTLIICVGMFSVMFFVPLFLQYQQGYSTLAAASAILPVTVAAFVFGLFGGWLADRVGNAVPAVVGFALLAVGFVLLAQMNQATSYGFTALALTLTGIGMSLPLAPTAAAALGSVPTDSVGEASGIFNLFHNLGRPFGLAGLGTLLAVQAVSSYQEIFWLSAIVVAVGAIVSLGLGGKTPEPTSLKRSLRQPIQETIH